MMYWEFPKINEFATNSKNKNIRDLCGAKKEFKEGYQSRSSLVKDEHDDLLADSHNYLNTWMNYFSALLNVHSVRDFKQIEIHTAGPWSLLLLRLKLLLRRAASDEIPVETIQARGEKYGLRSINSLILFGIKKNCLISGRSLLT
jgi:hypothetical protein